MTDIVKAWIEERQAIHAKATDGTWEAGEVINWGDANDVPQAPILSTNGAITWDDHGGEVFKPDDATAIVDAHKNLPRALTALEDLIGIAHLMDEEAREYDHEGRVLAAQIARGHAASIRSAIESALEAGE